MKRGRVLGTALLALAVAIATGAAPEARSASSRSQRAESLFRSARERLETGTIEQRRVAIAELEEATALDSGDPRYQLALAHAYFDAELTNLAHGRFERAAALLPAAAEPIVGLGDVAKRDWLSTLVPASLDRAIGYYTSATRLEPDRAEGWLRLAPLLQESGQTEAALAAAERASAEDPQSGEAALAAAYLSYRSGQVTRAESLFATAFPRLPRALRARFADLSPLIPQQKAEDLEDEWPTRQAAFAKRFWEQSDPDPTTPENEAQLEYWSRVAHAGFLYSDPAHERWDVRAELYVRYGPPKSVAYEPNNVPLYYDPTADEHVWYPSRLNGWRRVGEPVDFATHAQLWRYPNLGMAVLLNDYTLSENYRLPPRMDGPVDVVPSDRALGRGDLVFTSGGRAMFPTVPPGTRVLPAAVQVCRFEGEQQTRLLAQVEAPGSPVDSVTATCTLMDSTRHEISRISRALSPSGCDPTTVRNADFAFDVPPGAYRVNFSLHDGHGARAVLWAAREIEPAPPGLGISDVVVTCGPIDIAPARPAPARDGAELRTAAAGPPIIRLGPNLRGRVSGREPLIAYFEVYHLAPGEDGRARFEYEYTVHSEDKDPRPWYKRMNPFAPPRFPRVQVRGEDENAGALRRQFVSVPVSALPVGHYRLEVRIRDRTSGATVLGVARFQRLERENPTG